MLRDEPPKPKSNRWHWILWWQIDPDEVSVQLANYNFGPFQTARGWSALALLFSVVVSALLIAFRAMPLASLADCVVMLALAIFIYLGHRWAMIGAMIVWSIEKLIGLFSAPATAVVSVVWWAAYMHAFYLAYKVETARRDALSRPEEVFD